MDISEDNIIGKISPLIGFSGETKYTIGEIKLPVYVEGLNSMQKFCVVDVLLGCNIILGRPWIHEMRAVPSTYHQCVKIPTPWRVVTVKEEQDVKEVNLIPEDPNIKVLLGAKISKELEVKFTDFLKKRMKTFAWKQEDMIGISKDVITHKLGIDKSFKPIQQKRRKFTPKRNAIIQEDVERLLKAKMIKEVKFPEWLANVVVMQKKNGKWRVCVDFTDLNKACPKSISSASHRCNGRCYFWT
uniref:uncharacterized protein LOC122584738 n=1 Tax=Erigeron canadensis TaxID=72917 RepID=UPI001CB8E804|nr:uncharacterized protein LOC122584738 [Erigeron canadensis]